MSPVHRCNGWGPVCLKHAAENMRCTARRCNTTLLEGYRKEKKNIKKYSAGVNWRNEGLRNSNEDIKH